MPRTAHLTAHLHAATNVVRMPLPTSSSVATIRPTAMALVAVVSLACWAAAGHAVGFY